MYYFEMKLSVLMMNKFVNLYSVRHILKMQVNINIKEQYGLSDEELNLTMSSYTPLDIAANQYFLKQGSICDKIGFVKKGLLRSFFYNEEGNEITTQFYSEGSLIISSDSLNNQVPSKENITAIENSELMIIGYKRQKELYELVPAWNQICKDLADMFSHEMLKRSVQFQTLSATERYRLFCNQNPEIIKKAPLRHIASYLGIDIATLSRIRKKYIKFAKYRIVTKNYKFKILTLNYKL